MIPCGIRNIQADISLVSGIMRLLARASPVMGPPSSGHAPTRFEPGDDRRRMTRYGPTRRRDALLLQERDQTAALPDVLHFQMSYLK
jgi:hypothetical protein